MKTDTDTLAPAGLPACLDRAQELLDWMRKKSLPEMKAVWKCSDKIAQEAYGSGFIRRHSVSVYGACSV